MSGTTLQTLPTLYKKTRTGALQYWRCGVEGSLIKIEFGQVGTSSPQFTSDHIREGKNLGRSNATTPEQQALQEARSRWKLQIDDGYVEDIERARRGERDNPAPIPMLAHTWDKQSHKVKYPCFVQPKMDGIRCMAVREPDGSVTLYSRKGKLFTSTPHIQEVLAQMDWGGFTVLDGELYNHEYHADFEHITHLVKQTRPIDGHQVVQFHIFDGVSPVHSFEKRWALLKDQFGDHEIIKLVETTQVLTSQEVDLMYDHFAGKGYEGVMVRSGHQPYEHSRSYSLLKYKMMVTEEFTIVDVEEGKAKLAGHGIFVCETKQGDRFSVKMKGELSGLREYLENKQAYIGKPLTVQFQNYSAYQIPRFPVGIAIRDYE